MESDYTLIYFHHGLTGENKPSLGWVREAYKEFDRKYVTRKRERERGAEGERAHASHMSEPYGRRHEG